MPYVDTSMTYDGNMQPEKTPANVSALQATVVVPAFNMEWKEFDNSKGCISRGVVESVLKEFGVADMIAEVHNLYLNQVFLVKVSHDHDGTNLTGTRYILKVLSSTYTKYVDEIRAVTALMSKAHMLGLNEQYPLRNKHGDTVIVRPLQLQPKFSKGHDVKHSGGDRGCFIIRLFTYTDGQPLSDVMNLRDDVILQFGEKLGKFHVAMKQQAENKATLESWGKISVWSLDQMPRIREILHSVKDPSKRSLVETVIEAFETNVLSVSDELPKGFIHGDYTGRNVLFKNGANLDCLDSLVMIDFDDAFYGCLLYDVAIAVTSLLERENCPQISNVTIFLKGYQTHRHLTSVEKHLLFYCVSASLAQVLVGDQFMASCNDEHLAFVEQSTGWSLLATLCDDNKYVDIFHD